MIIFEQKITKYFKYNIFKNKFIDYNISTNIKIFDAIFGLMLLVIL